MQLRMSLCLCLALPETLYIFFLSNHVHIEKGSWDGTLHPRFNHLKVYAKVLKHGCYAERKLFVIQVCKLTGQFACNLSASTEASFGLSTHIEHKTRFNLRARARVCVCVCVRVCICARVYVCEYIYMLLFRYTETFRQVGVTTTW